MRKSVMRRPSPALVVSFIALLVALGGTSYAAFSLPKNSVGTKQLKKNAVTNSKIKSGAVTASKINTSGLTVPNALHANSADTATSAGSAGSAGSATNASELGGTGPSGYAGATQWALVEADGTIDSQSGGISVFASGSAGSFYVNFGQDVSHRPILVTLNYGNFAGTIYVGGQVTAAPCGGASTDTVRTLCGPAGTDDSNHVFVKTTDPAGTANSRPFYIAVLH